MREEVHIVQIQYGILQAIICQDLAALAKQMIDSDWLALSLMEDI